MRDETLSDGVFFGAMPEGALTHLEQFSPAAHSARRLIRAHPSFINSHFYLNSSTEFSCGRQVIANAPDKKMIYM
jgi:hypothetical protein